MEYWGTDALLAITAVAGKPLAVDTFTKERRKMGYARVKVAIDVSLPLKPGVLLKGDSTDIWQAFIYESLPAFCFDCGRIGHDSVACPNRLPEVTEIGCSESRPPSSGPSTAFGPWLAAMRLRPMGAPNRPPPASRSAPLGVSSSPFPRPSPVGKCPAPPSSATGGWQKPAKVARRCSPVKASSVGSPVPAPSSSSFAPLASLGSAGEGVAPVLEGVLRPCPASLKRARSPVGRRARSSSGSKTSRPSPARAGRGTRASRGRTASVGPSMVAGRARGRSGPRIDTPGPCLVGHGEASSCSLPPLGAVLLGDLPGGAFRAGGPALLPGAVRPGALVDVAALSGGALEDGEVLAGDSGVSAGVCAAGEAAGASVAGSTVGDEFGGLLGVEALHQAAVGRVKAALALAGQAVSAGAEVLQSDGALPMEVSEESLPRAAQGVQPAEVYL